MSGTDNAPKVASVGSPSSNYEVTVDLNTSGRDAPLVGAMLSLTNNLGPDASELAIGTVTEVTTRNRWHEDPNLRATMVDGAIDGMSGNDGDTRQATIRLQAAWRRDGDGPWKASGPSLRNSPATGAAVRLVDDGVIAELTAGADDLHYAGHLGGTDRVRLPLSLPDFSGPMGAWSAAIYGLTGSGKSQFTAYLLAGQMRHRDHGMIIVDPQGQWAAEEGMAFSLQGFAAELGRPVRVRRISEHLRLGRDAGLFTSLLGKTRFLAEITKMSAETQDLVLDEMVKIVRDTDSWEDMDSRTLMRDLLTTMVDPNAKYLSRIYADETRQERLRDAIDDILDDAKRMEEVLRLFAAIHNLFQATNPVGGTRHSLWAEITAVFDKPAGAAAPLLILDMSSKAPPGMSDAAAMAAAAAYETLENDNVKAAILRNLFSTLKRASEDQFRNGRNLNTLVVLDEAWRYAPNPQGVDEPEIVALSKELAGYARDTRKFGIGWLYISQSTRSVNQSIWEQMTVRVFGFGLSGADLDKVGEILDDRSSLRLYRAFGNPRSTGRYPFLLTGPVSPLSANATPVVLNVYTDFQDFRDDNVSWIKAVRDQLGQSLAVGAPAAPRGSGATPLPRISKAAKVAARNPVAAIVETNAAVAENLAKNGVSDAAGFGDPLGSLDDETVPF
jgi:DNA helicase HerA-like ATPase